MRTAYLQVRLQSRFGTLPAPADWRALEATGNFAHCLDTARRTPLKPWVERMDPEQPVHTVERLLRENFAAHAREVAHWTPPPWRDCVALLEELPLLPLSEQDAGGRSAFFDAWNAHRLLCEKTGLNPASVFGQSLAGRMSEEQRLRRLFRALAFDPGAAFAYLLLVFLVVERLRGLLVRRQLFPPGDKPP